MEERFNGYRIERLNENNIYDLCYLFKAVHNRIISVEYFRRKFETEWTGKKYIGYFAYSESAEPAAFYAVFPCFITDGKTIALACQSGDSITNPKYQKKGLFVFLAERTYRLAESEGIKMVFGFPNQYSSHGLFDKADWNRFENFNDYEINYRSIPLYNLSHKFEILQPLYRIYFGFLRLFIGSSEGMNNSNIDDGTFGIMRDSKFYLYKRYERSYFVKWKGFMLWIKFDNGIMIGDIEKFDVEKCYGDFFNALRQLCFVLGVNKARISCSPDSFADKLFSKTGTPTKGLDAGYRIFDESLLLKSMKFTPGDMDTF